VISTKIGFKRK